MFSCRPSGVGGLTCWCMRRMVTGFNATARASTELCKQTNTHHHLCTISCFRLDHAPYSFDQLPSCFCS